VLVVVGADAGGLSKAANAIAAQDRQPALSGAVSIVRGAVEGSPAPRTELPRAFPQADTATLAELDIDDQTVRGRYAGGVVVPLRVEGDAIPRPGGGELELHYAYGAQLDTRLSAMEVRLDGITLRSVPLADEAGEPDARVRVRLPEEILTPSSRVEVLFHLFPQQLDVCRWTTDQHLWATVLASSTVSLPRDHAADMPDLSRLRHGGWPYTADPAHPVIVGLPASPDADAWAAGVELVASIARISAADRPAVRLALASSATLTGPEQVVLVGDATVNPAVKALGSDLTVSDEGPVRRLRSDAPAALVEAASTAVADTIEQVAREGGRSALVLRATTSEGLRRLVDTLTDPARAALLSGNVVVVAQDGSLRSLDVAPRTQWGELPLDTRARRLIRREWWIVGAAAIAGAMGTVWLVRRIARRGRA
jgi:hypothetical protein